MVDVQVVLVPLLAVALKPSFWNGSNEATTSGQIDVFGCGMLLMGAVSEMSLSVWIRRSSQACERYTTQGLGFLGLLSRRDPVCEQSSLSRSSFRERRRGGGRCLCECGRLFEGILKGYHHHRNYVQQQIQKQRQRQKQT